MSIRADHHRDECEIVSTRTFEASAREVWDAFRDPARLARWWGPKGFTNTFHEFDFRPGGAWLFVMHAPTGAYFENHSEFIEVDEAARIVLNHVSEPRFRMTILLDDLGGKTRMTWRMLFPSAKDCERLAPLCVPSNEQNFDRLAAELRR